MDGDSATSLASRTSAPSSAAALDAVARARPERNAVSDSLLAANANKNDAHLRSRRVRLAVALLFVPPPEPPKDTYHDLYHI